MRESFVKTLTRSKVPQEMIEVIERSEMGEMASGHLFGNLTNRNTCIGDALHPMTPDLGHGGCVAVEDGVILSRYLAADASRWKG
jgi:2-polyprenyl-6-methoxyphenol hydroxylase-like FAD-dependent oxidoreductase